MAEIKIVLLLLLCVISLVEISFNYESVSLFFLCSLSAWIVIYMFSYLHGLINGFEFDFNLFFYFIVTPVFCAIASTRVTPHRLSFICAVLIISTVIVLLLNLYYIGFRLDLYAVNDNLLRLNAFGGTKITDEQLEVRMSSQSSLLFLLPFISTLFFFYTGKIKFLFGFVLFLSLFVVIFSGRRVLQVLFFFGVILGYFQYFFYNGVSLKRLSSTVMYILLFLFSINVVLDMVGFFTDLKNPIHTFVNTILLSFDSSEGGGIQRHDQSIALTNYFSSSPLFGHGLNSHPDYIRNEESPWSYEWVYLALLAQNGIFVFLFTFAVFTCIAMKILAIAKDSNNENSVFFYAIFNGYVCYIIAGASNPMVYFSWFWFLSFIAFNVRVNK